MTARAANIPTSLYLEKSALGATDQIRFVPAINEAALVELRRQGTNLNQLAHSANSGRLQLTDQDRQLLTDALEGNRRLRKQLSGN